MNYATLPIKYVKDHINKEILVEIEESTEFCARLTTKNKTHMIIGADLGVNSSSSCRVSDDKLFSYYFLNKDGIRTIDTIAIEKEEDLKKIKFTYPYILKPNQGLGGDGFLVVSSERRLPEAYEFVKKYSEIIVAQKFIKKREYRIVVFNEKLYFAYERTPYKIVGDGVSSIKSMILDRNSRYKKTQQIDLDDFRMNFQLREHEKDLNYIPLKGEEIFPFSNSNLKCGGSWNDVTHQTHEKYSSIAILCAKSLGLKIAGIDIFADSISEYDEDYLVIEANSSPGFEYIRSNTSVLDTLFSDVLDSIK